MADAQTVIHVRSRLPLAEISTAVQRQVEALDPDVPLFDIKSAGEQIRDSYWQQELSGMLIGIFAIIALLLGAVGMYGVMAYMVSERTREIGIRMALGARPADVLSMILRQAMRVTGIAILAGVASALALSRVMASLLYGVSPRDPMTFAVIVAALTMVALAASYLPARRATVVDPMIALRDE
jgi:ABC-type antimicrobial peptide transport system permease subunit